MRRGRIQALAWGALTGWLVCVLVAGARAEDHLRLKSGKLLSGKVVSYDRAQRVVSFETSDGGRVDLPVKDLDRLSAYKLAKTKAKKGDPRNELLLGDFARDIELYAHARRHYQKAVDLDPALDSEVESALVELRTEAAAYCMRNAEAAIADEDSLEAEKWLTTLVEKLPDEPEAKRASSLLATYYPQNHETRDDELERDHDELLAKELKTGKRHYDLMLRNIQRGLTNTRSTSASIRSLETAWREGERALEEIEKTQKKIGADARADDALEGYRALVKEHMVSAALHIASMLTTRSSYTEAQRWVNQALAIDPGNREAKSARARIEVASSRGWGWGWR